MFLQRLETLCPNRFSWPEPPCSDCHNFSPKHFYTTCLTFSASGSLFTPLGTLISCLNFYFSFTIFGKISLKNPSHFHHTQHSPSLFRPLLWNAPRTLSTPIWSPGTSSSTWIFPCWTTAALWILPYCGPLDYANPQVWFCLLPSLLCSGVN